MNIILKSNTINKNNSTFSSLPTGKDLSRKVPPRKSLSAIYRQNNNKTLPKKNDVRKSTCPIVPKSRSAKPVNHLPKTPTASKAPKAKTPEYMDQSKSLR